MRIRKHDAFTLIELVIVVAIIGILALMIIPQFNTMTEEVKVSAFHSNCRTVLSGIAAYQAANSGKMPANVTELGSVINGGWDSLKGGDSAYFPPGADYTYSEGVFAATYTDSKGNVIKYSYPD